MTKASNRSWTAAVPIAIFAVVFAAPWGFAPDRGLSLNQAVAANGNANGHDSNGGGGNGGGGNGGGGNGVGGNHADAGNAQGNGLSHSDQSIHSGLSIGQADADASGLGALNAAHASAQAFANASPNSEVGKIRTYEGALDRYLSDLNAGASPGVLNADIVAVGDALGAAANKTLTTDTVDRLNGLLGVSTVSDPNWETTTAPSVVSVANEP
jgi:Predicted membrane protein